MQTTITEKPKHAWIVSGLLFSQVQRDMDTISLNTGKCGLVKVENVDGEYFAYTWLEVEYFSEHHIRKGQELGYEIILMSTKDDKIKILLQIPNKYDFKRAYLEALNRGKN